MALNRKFVLILAILLLGMVFLAGCGEGEETGLEGETGIADPFGTTGGEENYQDGDTGEENNAPAGDETEEDQGF